LLELTGGFTWQVRNPDSWEGWYWGAKHMWGQDPLGEGDIGNLLWDMANHCGMILFWGCDVETAPWGWGGQQASRYCFWLTELGVKQVYICPDVNYGCAVHADKWIPVRPNTDSALHLAIIYTWLQEELWDKEYIGPMQWVLRSSKDMCWVKKTEYPRRRTGPNRSAASRPGLSKR
jgi:trimethylamine-N-oxide reductase (cytochrome c)